MQTGSYHSAQTGLKLDSRNPSGSAGRTTGVASTCFTYGYSSVALCSSRPLCLFLCQNLHVHRRRGRKRKRRGRRRGRRRRRKWENANQMLAQGTVKKNRRTSQEPSAGSLSEGRKGWDRCWRKERKGRKKSEKNWDEIHSLGAGPCLPITSFSYVKACPVLGSLPAAAGSMLAACVQMSVCSKARDLGEKPRCPGVWRLCHQNLSVH